jgi:cardiolipin synthase
MLHAKTAVVDGWWCTVGSANLDCRSRFHNDEANAIVLDGDLGARMETLFLEAAGTCDEIEPERWRRRSSGRRLMEHGAKLVYRWI